MPGSNSEIQGRFHDGLGRHIMVQYSVCSIIALLDPIIAMEYMERLGNQVHPMIHTLFPNNDGVLQENKPSFTQL
jgi:hypothetical protein